jgi:hypothetical protein
MISDIRDSQIGDQKIWQQSLLELRASDFWNKEEGSAVLDLGEFSRRFIQPLAQTEPVQGVDASHEMPGMKNGV